MAQKYLRQVKATFSGASSLVVTDLKIAFDISKSISGVPNEGKVQIWNLSKDHRNAIGKEFDRLTLEAGYVQTGMGVILKGSIREVYHDRDEVDVISEVSVGDGDEADRTGVVAKTWPRGTKIKDIVQDIYRESMPGISLGELKGLDDLPDTRRPVTIVGSPRRAMDMLGRTHKFNWSWQNETLETIPVDGYLNQIAYVSAQTGMVGVPTVTDRGITFQALLDAAIRPNRLVMVQSEVLDMNDGSGLFRVNNVGYHGDNGVGGEGDFLVEAECERVSGGMVTG
ncbi:MAG: hypothetical protein M9939_26580 [Mesorhizobium sp.]|nr:hypothetical protein [Mesorhizobium sp.]MCO5164660.1 hypothetical protein [Mesorhizobium sp.]